MVKPVVMVTGANGQLGSELRAAAPGFPAFDFIFLSRDDLPIHRSEQVSAFFSKQQPAYVINCAAYTAVDKAESDREMAYLVNAVAPGILAQACKEHGAKFIHVSTDYVFNGDSPKPYVETDKTDPANVYGASKLQGEELTQANDPDAIIIRTAWVYSTFGNNFVKTMLRLMKERESLNVVNDQVGAPTYAADLAAAILQIISGNKWEAGIYHYSNKGRISWYDFAVAIKEISGAACIVNPIPSSQYPTPAKRPSFSLLDTEKIQQTFGIEIPEWRSSLIKCLQQLKPAS
jgi:dTDP-4-dehydrorhamnose reductase